MGTLDYGIICFIFKNLQSSQETQNPPILAVMGVRLLPLGIIYARRLPHPAGQKQNTLSGRRHDDVDRVADAEGRPARLFVRLTMHTQSRGVAFAVVAKDAQLEHIVGLTQWLASPCIPPS
jgi:hypothetical protein